ncbi:MAG: NADH-quinone oxidoreductase subunit L [Actinobacteria bacterium]|nr:NADH-quinone oxidoreductase subunit L [Actinomycetota bacterium]
MLDVSYLIPALPLAGFALLVLFGSRLKGTAAGWLATLAVGASFLVTVGVFIQLLSRSHEDRALTRTLFTWFSSGGLHVKFAFLLDPLSVTMALFVTGVGTLIHLYSIGYMKDDERFARFFVYLNLFAFSMLMLVLADNFVVTFLGWEGVGACSYLLVSFWFEREAAATAGKKAFVTNRVGDFGFMLGMFLLFSHLGTLQYKGVFANLGHLPHSAAVAVALLLFLGATGKSAQLPLYVWLPDAMEGPTPVSALIHAATMVTAGVFLMVRISPILHMTPGVLTVIAIVGAVTALFAATIACAQDDIKKVLAYSTISQLGYMFLAVGSGAYVAAIFHMVTHAFFKALLFLGAGSVIHGLHEEQDMKRMGALRKWMPITSATFIVGWLAIAGIPPFAGFWSKDDILTAAWGKSPVLWAVGAVTALLTAYYMTRQVVLVFYGEERWRQPAEQGEPDKAELTEPEPVADEHASDEAAVHAGAHDGHGGHGAEPHESPWTMALPLVVLAALAVVGGGLNLPFTKHTALLERWLEPVVGRFAVEPHASKLLLGAAALTAAAIGLALGLNLWRRINRPELEPVVLKRAWGVDALYAAIIETPGRALAAFSAFVVDKQVVDGAVNGVATLVRNGGGQLRRLQTGYVRNYALAISAGGALLLGWVVFRVVGG